MSRIHPAVNNNTPKLLGEGQYDHHGCPSTFTVWKRSSMSFQGTDGFTVYDEYGTLAFRVDNYSRKNGFLGSGGGGGGLVLMDGSGKALLTLTPKVTDQTDSLITLTRLNLISYDWSVSVCIRICNKI